MMNTSMCVIPWFPRAPLFINSDSTPFVVKSVSYDVSYHNIGPYLWNSSRVVERLQAVDCFFLYRYYNIFLSWGVSMSSNCSCDTLSKLFWEIEASWHILAFNLNDDHGFFVSYFGWFLALCNVNRPSTGLCPSCLDSFRSSFSWDGRLIP